MSETKKKVGRPKGSTNSRLSKKNLAKLDDMVKQTEETKQEYKSQGGRIHKLGEREYAVVDVDDDPFITPEPPKKAGRPTKAQKAFEDTKIPVNRALATEDIPTQHLKELRQLSAQNPTKRVWLDNGMGYYQNGTLFSRFSLPLGNSETLDVKISDILTGLVVYLHQNPNCYQLEPYLSSIGVTLKWLEQKVEERESLSHALELAKQICKQRLVQHGFLEGNSALAKFLLQAEHDLSEKKRVETTNTNINMTSQEVEETIKSKDSKQMMDMLSDMLGKTK